MTGSMAAFSDTERNIVESAVKERPGRDVPMDATGPGLRMYPQDLEMNTSPACSESRGKPARTC